MKKFLTRSVFFSVIYIVLAIIVEIVTFLMLNLGLFPTYFILDLAIMFCLATIIFIIPSSLAQSITAGIILLIQIVISYINITLYEIYGDLLSLDMIALGGEAFKAFDPADLNGLVTLIFVVLAVVYILLSKKACKCKMEYKYKFKSRLSLILLGIFIVNQAIVGCSYYLQYNALQLEASESTSEYEEYFENDAALYESLVFKVDSLKKFGTYAFYAKGIFNMLSLSDLSDQEYDDICNYIIEGEQSTVNSNTGLWEDNNIIVIMVESLEWFAIDPDYTPTLYMMSQEGYTLNNYYSKNKTNISETDVILGNQPLSISFYENYFSENPSEELIIPFTLPNKLKEAGYTSINFFHDYLDDFYRRYLTHPAMGFDDVIDMDDMNISNASPVFHDFVRDSDMFKNVIDQIAPTDEKFFSFITTVTSHGPYTYNYRLDEYYDMLADTERYTAFVEWFNTNYPEYEYPTDEDMLEYYLYYKAAIMDLDAGLAYLLQYLEDNNMSDNTSIVLYADHYAYYNELTYDIKNIGNKIYYNTELYRVPCIIYDTALGTKQEDMFSCVFNITPTILDLCGITYNEALYAGYSIFSEKADDTIFVSRIGGVMRNDIYSDNVVDIVDEETYDELEVQKFREDSLTYFIKQGYINDIYKYNVFSKYPDLLGYI
ncbi:MAG: LTA synthase family protein [Clostridia bacterium]|jgi:phosphoglycerol transferase MdoB-like AlkP superfamily enzyme